MNKTLEEHSKYIDEIYKHIALMDDYIKSLEKRILELENDKDYNEYHKW